MRFVIGIVIAGMVTAASAQPQYEVVDLTKIYGTPFAAVDINDAGVIAGNYLGRACIAHGGKLTMLPKLNGTIDWWVHDIAQNGDILGHASGSPTPSVYYDASKGTVEDMGVPGGIAYGRARAINNLGQATGQLVAKTLNNPFIWEGGKITTILQPSGGGNDINDSQTIAGFGGPGGEPHAALWVDGVFQSLNPAWAQQSEAVAVNEMDEAVGGATAPGLGYHGLLWRGGKTFDLGNLGTQNVRPYDINNLSQIVGFSTNQQGIVNGFLWQDGVMYYLDDLVSGGTGFQLINAATSINGGGQIVASAFTGTSNSFVLFNPVPEASTLLALSTMTGFYCGAKVCRKKRQWRRKCRQSTNSLP